MIRKLCWMNFHTLYSDDTLSPVDEQMLGMALFCDRKEVAPFALIWLFYGMCFDVISQSACLWTHIIALWAYVWFLSPLRVSLCLFQCSARPNESLHSEFRELFTQCGWLCGSSSVLIGQMTYHILSKCGFSLHYGLWASMCIFREPATPNVALDTRTPGIVWKKWWK